MRVPLHWRLFAELGDKEARFEGPGWSLLDRLVDWCRESGLRVILDLHAAPGGQTGVNHDDGFGFPLTFYVPRYRRLTIELWRRLAAHYHDEVETSANFRSFECFVAATRRPQLPDLPNALATQLSEVNLRAFCTP